MTEKSKFDRKTPSASFIHFLSWWIGWSVLLGIITLGSLATITNRVLYSSGQSLPAQSILLTIVGTGLGGIGVFFVSRWQHKTLHKKTGREFKHWALWSSICWMVGMGIALVVIHQVLIHATDNMLATLGIIGLGLAIIYGFLGFCHSWLIGQQIENSIIYGIVMVVGVLFWMLFIGDPRRIVLGGIFAPALQGFVSGIVLMWLFHLAKLGNIARETTSEDTV